jgi:hypothetical protein
VSKKSGCEIILPDDRTAGQLTRAEILQQSSEKDDDFPVNGVKEMYLQH